MTWSLRDAALTFINRPAGHIRPARAMCLQGFFVSGDNMKLKAIAEACLWLPGFAPNEDPVVTHGVVGGKKGAGVVIPFPESQETKAKAEVKAAWPRLDASVFADLSGDVAKFDANVAAIELLRKLESDGRQPTDDERVVLNRYTGWRRRVGYECPLHLKAKIHNQKTYALDWR